MADRSKFEEMLELLINENKEAAEELFHEIVVEKSRDIYESLLEDEEEVDETDDNDADDEEVDESDDNDADDEEGDDDLEEGFDLDEFEVEADDDMMGGDPADDMMADVEPGDEEDGMDDMGGEGDLEGKIDDLSDKLDDLAAEFEKLMAAEEGEGHDFDNGMDMGDEEGDMDMGDEEGDEEDDTEEGFAFESDDEDEDDVEESKSPKSAAEQMREYVEKIGGDRYDSFGKMGDNGVQTKSPVAGKNDMGGTTANIINAGTEKSPTEANKGKLKGSALSDQSAKAMSTKNVNVPGGKAGVKHLSKKSGGGLDNNSILKKDGADKGAKSPINGVKTRAK